MLRLMIGLLVLACCSPAMAYIGPGAGISFLGSIWTLIVGIVVALGAILFWPIRMMLRKSRGGKGTGDSAPEGSDDAPDTSAKSPTE